MFISLVDFCSVGASPSLASSSFDLAGKFSMRLVTLSKPTITGVSLSMRLSEDCTIVDCSYSARPSSKLMARSCMEGERGGCDSLAVSGSRLAVVEHL